MTDSHCGGEKLKRGKGIVLYNALLYIKHMKSTINKGTKGNLKDIITDYRTAEVQSLEQ